MRKVLRLAAITSLALATVVLGAGAAGAAPGNHHRPGTCTGTFKTPGVLAGKYKGGVVVTGVCAVNGGAAVVQGDLILAPGSALNATFALNDVAGTGRSSLTVKGDVKVGSGALLAMGCEPNFSPCSDDPNAGTGGTLTGQNKVFGDIRAVRALGVLLHASTIKQDVSLRGGGGAESCDPPFPGIFADLGSPPFSDAEDNSIGGNLTITGLRSCWLGALRNSVPEHLRRAQHDGRPGRDGDPGQPRSRQHGLLQQQPGGAIRRLREFPEQGQAARVRRMRFQRTAAESGTQRTAHADLRQGLTFFPGSRWAAFSRWPGDWWHCSPRDTDTGP